ncbi:MAG: uracil-DNA glycosylase [Pseudomonadales bacterium]|nr:uracil-DNA glycosylase [Pseudomonadales bacterium]
MTQVLPQLLLPQSWRQHLQGEFDLPYMLKLLEFLQQQQAQGKVIYPELKNVFSAFEKTPFDQLKVVILGQDPYHGEGQAQGLSFSVPKGIKTPPSLVNMYKELHSDVDLHIPAHGNLEPWAQQGVLLLNAVLTVEQQQAASHQGQGWEVFTDQVISVINQHCDHVVFLLWGAYAQRKGKMIDANKHLVLSAPHPSPLSAYRGFFGCRHFSKANQYLQQWHKTPIDWQC